MEAEIQALKESDCAIVFKFGYAGAGKTCFLVALYKYLLESQSWDLGRNPGSNHKGISRVNGFLNDVNTRKRLPPNTPPDSINVLDLTIQPIDRDYEDCGEEFAFSILDMSGEDLREFVDKGSFRELQQVFLTKELPLIIMYFVDYDKLPTEDVTALFEYLERKETPVINKCLVVTKFDKAKDKSRRWKEIAAPVYKAMRRRKIPIFEFSIGNVNPQNPNYLLAEMDTSYCEKMVKWLYSSEFSIPDTGNLFTRFWYQLIAALRNRKTIP